MIKLILLLSILLFNKDTIEVVNYIDKQDVKKDLVTKVIRSLPEVMCTNEIVDKEIRHFLNQQDEPLDTCFWNLRLYESDIIDVHGKKSTKCSMYRDVIYVADPGIAFINYGKDIIVLENNLYNIFEPTGNYRTIEMGYDKVPWQCCVPYLEFLFTDRYVISLSCEYDPLRGSVNPARREKNRQIMP